MTETKMKEKLKTLLPQTMFQSIETSTGLGVPDMIYAHGNVQGWIECKKLDEKPKKNFKMPWRPGQLGWYSNYRRKYKIRCPYFVCLTIKDDWYFIDDIKEKYTMDEIRKFYFGKTKELLKHQLAIFYKLLSIG